MGKYLDGGGLDTLWGRIGQKVGTKADKVLKVTVTRSGSSPNYTYSLDKTMTQIVDALGAGTNGNTTVVLLYNNVAYWFYKTSTTNSNTNLHFTSVNSDASSVSTSEFVLTPNTSAVAFSEKTLTPVTDISGKQDTLVSGTNIKTIDSISLLGSGNVEILPYAGNAITGNIDGVVTPGFYKTNGTVGSRGLLVVNSTISGRTTTITQTRIVDGTVQYRKGTLTNDTVSSWSAWSNILDADSIYYTSDYSNQHYVFVGDKLNDVIDELDDAVYAKADKIPILDLTV